MANAKQKQHNWDALYIDFLSSDHLSVTSFLRSRKINPTTGNARRQTAKWAQKRHEIGTKIRQRVEAELEEAQVAASVKKKMDALTVARNFWPMFATMMRRRAMGAKAWDAYVKENYIDKDKPTPAYFANEIQAEAAWRMVTTELGEPTSIRNQKIQTNAHLTLADVVRTAANERRARQKM